jgi:hypothetical protein
MPTIKYEEGQELSQSHKNTIEYAKRILRAAKEGRANGFDNLIDELITEFSPQQQLQPPVVAAPPDYHGQVARGLSNHQADNSEHEVEPVADNSVHTVTSTGSEKSTRSEETLNSILNVLSQQQQQMHQL